MKSKPLFWKKSIEKKINQCEIRQKSLNSQNVEISKLHDNLKQNGRILKLKEKEIYNIAKKNDDFVDTCKMRKEAISKLKKEPQLRAWQFHQLPLQTSLTFDNVKNIYFR